MATIDSLANETLSFIMEMLKEPGPSWSEGYPTAAGRYNALRAAALVCSRWRDPAQRVLFDEVELSQKYPLRTEQFLTSPAHPRHRTRSLWSVETVVGWLEVAESCRGLHSLEILFPDDLSTQMLARPCFAGLKRLTILANHLVDVPLDSGSHLPRNLTSLALWTTFDQHAVAFLTATASSSIETLDILHLRVSPRSGSPLVPALGVVGPHLRSFMLESAYPNIDLEIFAVFTALESFLWRNYSPSALRASDMENLRKILDSFPSPATLRHLSIGTDDLAALEHITQLLAHRRLALLTTFDLPFLPLPTSAAEASVVAAMAKACEDRGIQWSMGGAVQGL